MRVEKCVAHFDHTGAMGWGFSCILVGVPFTLITTLLVWNLIAGVSGLLAALAVVIALPTQLIGYGVWAWQSASTWPNEESAPECCLMHHEHEQRAAVAAKELKRKIAAGEVNCCPVCKKPFSDTWGGLASHWRARHSNVMSYADAKEKYGFKARKTTL